jgi:hypothetical protein
MAPELINSKLIGVTPIQQNVYRKKELTLTGMKKMLPITTLLLLLGVMTSLESCDLFEKSSKPKTELEKLPPATQEGKNTFGCLVDGKAWVTKTSIDADAYYQEGLLFITASVITSNSDQIITMSLFDLSLSEKEYALAEHPEIFGRLRDLKNNCEYLTSSSYTGKLIITHFDQINFIISGTFEFEAYSNDCDKIVKITHGRFDLNYAP